MSISDLKVMRSAAGYYIGRSYFNGDFDEPYSRESGYYPTEKAANKDMKTFVVRDCAENEQAYASKVIRRPYRP